MKSFEEIINQIARLKKNMFIDSIFDGFSLGDDLKRIAKLLSVRKIDIDEYLVNLWDEPDFQLRVLEEYCGDTIKEPLPKVFYFFHFIRSLFVNIEFIRNSFASKSDLHTSLKKFILDMRNMNNLLMKGTFTRIAGSFFENRHIMNLAVIKTNNFDDFRNLNIIVINHNKSVNKNYTLCKEYMKQYIIPINSPLACILKKKTALFTLEDINQALETTSSFEIIEQILSSRLMLGNLHLYNELRGVIIKKFYDKQSQEDIRNRHISKAISVIHNNLETLRNNKRVDIPLLLDSASIFSTLAQIHYQIHRNNYYEILEKLKVIYQKKSFNIDSVFAFEQAVLIFHFLNILEKCFHRPEENSKADSVIDITLLSDLFDRITCYKKGFIRKNISTYIDSFLSVIESECKILEDNIFI